MVLYGFGRIGRLLARILIEKAGGGDKLRLRAAVVRKGSEDDLVKRASLLRRDSVHGPFQGTITVDEEENAIVANGNMIRIIYSDAPEKVDYTRYGIKDAIIIDNTGKWRDREGLGRHLQAQGAAKVILTAPGKGDIPNIVFGVNNELVTRRGNDPFRRQLHHQRHRPGAKGRQRPLRHCHRPRRNLPLLHQRPEPDRQLPQKAPPRAGRAAEHGHHRNRRRQGRRQGTARIGRQADGQRHPRSHPQRFACDPQPDAAERERT